MKRNGTRKGVVAILVALLLGVVGSFSLGQTAYAADDSPTAVVNVIQIQTQNGMFVDTKNDPDAANKIIDVNTMYFVQKEITKTFTGVTNTRWLEVLVNPVAPELPAGQRPTVRTYPNGDIQVNVSDTAGANAVVTELPYSTTSATRPWIYDVNTGVMYIDARYKGKYITIYDYIASNQTVAYLGGARLFVSETVNGTAQSNFPDAYGGTIRNSSGKTFVGLNRLVTHQMPFSQTTKVGYKNTPTVYGVVTNTSGVITEKFPLRKNQDYSIGADGTLKLKATLNVADVVVENVAVLDTSQVQIIPKNVTSTSISFEPVMQHTISLYKGKTLIGSGATYYDGLDPNTTYTAKLINSSGAVVSTRAVTTKDDGGGGGGGDHYTPPFSVGDVFYGWGHVDGHWDVPDASEPSGIATTFIVTLHDFCADGSGGSEDGQARMAELVNGNTYYFHCVTPFADYSDGQDCWTTIRCTNVSDSGAATFTVYGAASGGAQSWAGGLSDTTPPPIQIEIQKQVYNETIGNLATYNLSGAQYEIYHDGSYVDTIVTDDSGYAVSGDLDPQTEYVVREKAGTSDGMFTKTNRLFYNGEAADGIYGVITSDQAVPGETIRVRDWYKSDGSPLYQGDETYDLERVGFAQLIKHDKTKSETAGASSNVIPQGDAYITDTKFEIKYYASFTSTEGEPERTWIVHTDDDGIAKLDAEHIDSGTPYVHAGFTKEEVLAAGGDWDDSQNVMTNVWPGGTYVITETQEAEGYHNSNINETRTVVVGPANGSYEWGDPESDQAKTNIVDYDTFSKNEQNLDFYNEPMRGNIELIKADDNWNDSTLQGDATLAGAVFEIYNASENSVISPQTQKEVQPGKLVCTIQTFLAADGRYLATTDTSNPLAAAANGWTIPADWNLGNPDGALPYGQYVVVERDPSNGYMLNSEWVGRAINDSNVHGDIQFNVTNGNKFTLAGKTSNASAAPKWINDSGALVKFDNKKLNEAKASQEHYHNNDAVPQKGASLDTVDRADESWCEDTIFRAGIRIGKVDRQNGDYKPQGGATLETAVITISSLCDNPIWTLKGTYANGETPTWGKVEAWTGANRSKKDGVDFLNIVVHKVTKTDGTVQYYASTRDDKGQMTAELDKVLDLTLPYGRYMLREVSVDSPDHIYDTLTNINNGYMFDTISQNWRRQFSIGYATNTKHPALTYYSETGSFSTLVEGDALANPTAIRVTPSDTIAYDPVDNHPAGSQAANSKHGTILDMTATNDAVPNLVARFDIQFIKKDPDGKLLAGAVFAITSKTTGETHIAVTDENGKFTSFPTSNQLTWHTKKAALGTVNGNDEGILSKKSSAGITYLDTTTTSDNETVFDYASGVTYTTDEAGKNIVDSSNSKVGNGIWFYGRTDKKTYDPATATGNGSGGATGNVNQDTKQYISSVRPDDIQTVRNDMGAFPYDDYIVQELPTANTIDYKMVSFEIHMVQATKDAPSDGFKNRTEMELKSVDPQLLTSYPQYYEREYVDAGTTVDNELPEIHTTLVNEADVPIAAATENYTLIDKVEWYNLQNGHKYRIEGELWMKDENDVPIGTAPIATGKTTFTAQGKNGMTPMKFENLDLTKLGGASLVAYEFLYDEEDGTENVMAEHKDPTDEGQTVTIPEIKTTLQDSDGDKEVSAYKEVKLVDHIAYKGLKPNQTYTFTGTLHLQNVDAEGNITDGGVATDAAGNPITATKDELIKSRNGEVDIEFTFMAPDLQGKKVVAFEECKVLDQLYAVHTEIDDVAQTVYFPEIGTTALDGVTGDHIGLANEDVTLEDVVAYKNLVKGKTYTINGTLMDQSTGEPIQVAGGGNITGSYTFVAGYVKKESGEAAKASVADLKAALNKAEGISSVDADELATLSENLSKAFDENKDSLTEEKVIEILDGAKTELGDTVKDIDFDALKTAAKDYFKSLESADSSELVEDENATFEKFDDEITLVSGSVKVPFTMKGDDIRGKAIVVFERLYNSPDTPEEITPEGEHEVEISKTDAATSEELPGATLTVTDSKDKVVAQWVSGTTSKKIKLDEGTYTLTEVTAPNGYAVAESITFEVGPDGLVDGEKVEMKDATTDMPDAVAIHEDINDSNQQVNYPEIGTRALINDDETFAASEAAGKDIAVVDDVVSYTNLIPGRTYTIDGVIMDKATGQPAVQGNGQEIHSQVTFTPETASGEVFVKFTFEADIFTELHHDLVVFENAYMMRDGVEDNLIHVGKHEDINDLNQTVPWEDLPDDWPKTPIQPTGDDMPFMPLLITIGVAFGAAGAFGLRRRFTK